MASLSLKPTSLDVHLLVDSIPALIHTANPDGCLDYFNKPWLEYLGATLDRVTGWNWTAFVHPEDVDGILARWRACLATGEVFEYETRVRRADGQFRWMFHRKVPLRDDDGNVVKWYGSSMDIHERKIVEEQLRWNARELQKSEFYLAEGERIAHMGSWAVGPDGFDYWSPELFRIHGLDTAGKPPSIQEYLECLHPEDRLRWKNTIEQAVKDKADCDVEYRVILSDGGIKWIHTVGHPVLSEAGNLLGFLGSSTEVTERKDAEEALSRARAELAHVARVAMLNTFTASVAHELNQPLSGIITNASTCRRMLDGDPPNIEGSRETARRIIRDANRASDVIARLRALFSKKQFSMELLDLNEAAREVIALLLSDLQKNRVILLSDLAQDLPAVMGDRVQLQQVTLNLLRNASEAMLGVDDRPRELLVKTKHDEGDRVRLSVVDAGLGFRPEAKDMLFEAFYTTKSDGMGIGLSVSRSIIEKHHGCLWAEPNVGPGATFSFSIPCSPQRKSE